MRLARIAIVLACYLSPYRLAPHAVSLATRDELYRCYDLSDRCDDGELRACVPYLLECVEQWREETESRACVATRPR